jgi:hypothetical protein
MMHLIKKFPLLSALFISLVLCGAVSLALYLNEDWRQTTFALIVEEVDEDGEVVKKVKVEKPEPNRDQVREIARNQELKKREKLEENAKKLRKTVIELEEVVEARKKSLEELDQWDHLAMRVGTLFQEVTSFRSRQLNSRFLTSQPGLAKQLLRLRNSTNEHFSQMRVLALQEEVEDSDAWDALNQARELVESLAPIQDAIGIANETVAAMPIDGEEVKYVQLMTDRTAKLNELVDAAHLYLQDFEDFLIVDVAAATTEVEAVEDKPEETNLPNIVQPEAVEEAPAENTEEAAIEASETVPSEANLEAMETAELYESIQEMTDRLDEVFAENKAAELAELNQIDLEEAKEQVYAPTTDKGPELAEQLAQNQPNTSEEFKSFNEALDQAVSSSERIARQAESRLEAAGGRQSTDAESSKTADQLKKALSQDVTIKAKMEMAGSNLGRNNGNLQDLRALMVESYENSQGDGGEESDTRAGLSSEFDRASFDESNDALKNPSRIRINSRNTVAQALPGRRFDMDSSRKGWIFIDTWYMIGPWDLSSKTEFEPPLPPETMVDLDASYEGKLHPKTKKPMELGWHFIQSGSLQTKPPDELSSTIYFAYTEVFCESALDVVVAVASDDRAKLWINDLVVFQDVGLSSWKLDEGFRRVLLKPGYNKLLLRLENGPNVATFSVLMCPADAVLTGK